MPTIETFANYITIIFAVFGAITAAFWLALVIWAFRDMRLRSRDPFAQILAALLVATLPLIGILVYLILRPPETLSERYERALEEEALLQEIEERPRCPKCTRTVDGRWAMCPSCHTELKKICLECDHLLELGWTRCPLCTSTQPSERPELTPERLLPALRPALPAITVNTPQIAAPAPQPTREMFRRKYRSAEIESGENGTSRQASRIVADDNPTIATRPILLDEADSPQLTTRMEPLPHNGNGHKNGKSSNGTNGAVKGKGKKSTQPPVRD